MTNVGPYKINPYSVGIGLSRQNLTSVDMVYSKIVSVLRVNPCVAGPVFIHFQTKLNSTEIGEIVCGRCSVNQIIQFGR